MKMTSRRYVKNRIVLFICVKSIYSQGRGRALWNPVHGPSFSYDGFVTCRLIKRGVIDFVPAIVTYIWFTVFPAFRRTTPFHILCNIYACLFKTIPTCIDIMDTCRGKAFFWNSRLRRHPRCLIRYIGKCNASTSVFQFNVWPTQVKSTPVHHYHYQPSRGNWISENQIFTIFLGLWDAGRWLLRAARQFHVFPPKFHQPVWKLKRRRKICENYLTPWVCAPRKSGHVFACRSFAQQHAGNFHIKDVLFAVCLARLHFPQFDFPHFLPLILRLCEPIAFGRRWSQVDGPYDRWCVWHAPCVLGMGTIDLSTLHDCDSYVTCKFFITSDRKKISFCDVLLYTHKTRSSH